MFQELLRSIRRGHLLSSREFEYALKLTREGKTKNLRELFSELLLVTSRGKQIRPKDVYKRQV